MKACSSKSSSPTANTHCFRTESACLPYGSGTFHANLLGGSWFIVTLFACLLRPLGTKEKVHFCSSCWLIYEWEMRKHDTNDNITESWILKKEALFTWLLIPESSSVIYCCHFSFNKEVMKHVQLHRHHPEAVHIFFFIIRIETINRVSCDIMLTTYSVHKQH